MARTRTAQTDAADTNENTTDATPKRVRLNLPAATEAELNGYFGTGEEGEANRQKALTQFYDRARQSAGRTAAKTADVEFNQDFVDSDAFSKSYADLRFGKRARSGKASTGRKVKRSAQDLSAAVNALGGVPQNEDELKALLAKLNVSVE
jgi:hypothetical protein